MGVFSKYHNITWCTNNMPHAQRNTRQLKVMCGGKCFVSWREGLLVYECNSWVMISCTLEVPLGPYAIYSLIFFFI